MSLLHVALFAVLAGAAEALPVSPSGHAVVARLFFDAGAVALPSDALAALGVAAGLAAASWRRLASALGEGLQPAGRRPLLGSSPSSGDAIVLLVASTTSVLVAGATNPRVHALLGSPTASGVGLVATGLALASTQLAPRFAAHDPARSKSTPTLAGAALTGVAHGLAVLPGASRVGAALTVLIWIGVRPARAIDLAFILTVPSLLITFARGQRAGALDLQRTALASAVAFAAALLAAEVLRGLVERRRLAVLALWTIPLGLATLAYARALPHAL